MVSLGERAGEGFTAFADRESPIHAHGLAT